MLFRHFGSKASLFSEASLQPFNDFLSQFAASWGVHVDEAELDESYLQEFVGGLYELARDRRKLIIDLVSAAGYAQEILGTSGVGAPTLPVTTEIQGVVRTAQVPRRGRGARNH